VSVLLNHAKYNNILKSLFVELANYWDVKTTELSKFSDEESIIELSLPQDASRLCFFEVNDLLPFYKSNIFPIFEQYGFTPIVASDVISPGDNIIAKVTSLIERSRLVVIDYSASLIGDYVLNRTINKNKEVWIIGQPNAAMPTNIKNLIHLQRPENIDSPSADNFIEEIERLVGDLYKKIAPALFDEPIRLLNKKEYRAAVISAFVILESKLNELLQENDAKQNLGWGRKLSLGLLRQQLINKQLISKQEAILLSDWTFVRNRLVHSQENIVKRDATRIVNGIKALIEHLGVKEKSGT
jgi:hypothetical protein